jgi:protein-S-isoprenylcysteine O-methyltransferase Ste14
MIGWIAYGVLVAPIFFLIVTHRAAGSSPLTIGLQIAGVALVVWARAAFGWRSFHAGSNPTKGGLVTSGPYRFVRHPIYAGVLLMLAGAVVAHFDAAALAAGAVAVAALAARIIGEERQVKARYPEYEVYARRTRRIIPWIF